MQGVINTQKRQLLVANLCTHKEHNIMQEIVLILTLRADVLRTFKGKSRLLRICRVFIPNERSY